MFPPSSPHLDPSHRGHIYLCIDTRRLRCFQLSSHRTRVRLRTRRTPTARICCWVRWKPSSERSAKRDFSIANLQCRTIGIGLPSKTGSPRCPRGCTTAMAPSGDTDGKATGCVLLCLDRFARCGIRSRRCKVFENRKACVLANVLEPHF